AVRRGGWRSPRWPGADAAQQPADLDAGVKLGGAIRIDGDPGDALRPRLGMDGDVGERRVEGERPPAEPAVRRSVERGGLVPGEEDLGITRMQREGPGRRAGGGGW